jgi:DNA-directed RNA polymerase specialized sigma24 family protein
LVGLEGLSYQEAANTIGTIRSRASRGRARLRALLSVRSRAAADLASTAL